MPAQHKRDLPVAWFVIADAASVLVAYLFALYVRFDGAPPAYNADAVWRTLPICVIGCVGLAHVYGLYERRPMTWPEQVQSIFILIMLDAVLCMASAFFDRSFAVPRSVIAIAAATDLLLLYAYRRLAYQGWVARYGPPRLLFLLPPGADGATAANGASFRIVGVLPVTDGAEEAVASVRDALVETGADGLLLSQNLAGHVKETFALLAVEQGLELFIEPRLLDLMVLQSRPSMFGDRLVINLTGAAGQGYQRALKRFIDVSLSALFLILTSPILGLSLLLVYLEDGAPVLYRQQRLGRNGRPFVVTKVRTMIRDAEAGTGAVLASPDDPRLTRTGRWLRQLHLDELPQLWNVLRGEMSLVGPRPERPELHEQVVASMPHFAHRLRVLPGLTGLAQVQGGYDTHPHEKLKFDMLYALRASATLDTQIILRTVRNVLGTLAERLRRSPHPQPDKGR